jgi:simple sugar transport system substrate-binding protein
MLTQQARYGLFPAQGQIVSTGPNFVTAENAQLALQTSARGIR